MVVHGKFNQYSIHNIGKLLQTLFSTRVQIVSTNALECVPTLITEAMNESLCCEFEESEVATALKQMAPLKDLGLMECLHFFTRTFGALSTGMLHLPF